MLDKNEDNFFTDKKDIDNASADLMRMIDNMKGRMPVDIKPGSRVEGTVARIGDEYLFIDIGTKNEALLKKDEITAEDGESSVKVGDRVSAYIVSNEGGETVLSKRLAGHRAAKQELFEALNNRIPVQGKVTGVSKDGLMVKILGHRAFCPISHIDIKFTDDVNQFLNKTLDFVITRITEGGKNIIVSRIPLLEKELSERLDKLEKCIEDRSVLRGKITKITDFGLFVDLGDVEGLVHVSEISWEHLESLKDVYSIGQEVDCIVLQVERREPLKNSKISLSIKQIYEDPWMKVRERFSCGQSVKGKVVRLTNFGAFVELIPGVDGLVHVSEMSWVKKVHHPSEVVSPGSMVNVTILAIDEKKRTISLSLKDVSNDPWRDVETRFAPGSETTGKVVKKSRYGYFVDLDEGVTGLLVYSNIHPEKKDTLKEGDSITVYIESVDKTNRRISLSHGIKQPASSQKETAENSDQNVSQVPAPPPASTEFGEALYAALKSRKT